MIMARILARISDKKMTRIYAKILVENLGKNSFQESWLEFLPRILVRILAKILKRIFKDLAKNPGQILARSGQDLTSILPTIGIGTILARPHVVWARSWQDIRSFFLVKSKSKDWLFI